MVEFMPFKSTSQNKRNTKLENTVGQCALIKEPGPTEETAFSHKDKDWIPVEGCLDITFPLVEL